MITKQLSLRLYKHVLAGRLIVKEITGRTLLTHVESADGRFSIERLILGPTSERMFAFIGGDYLGAKGKELPSLEYGYGLICRYAETNLFNQQ